MQPKLEQQRGQNAWLLDVATPVDGPFNEFSKCVIGRRLSRISSVSVTWVSVHLQNKLSNETCQALNLFYEWADTSPS